MNPAFPFEVERLEHKREQQTRTESKTRLVEQINIYLHASDYPRALDLLRGTTAEFPDDAELSALQKLAQDGLRRRGEADRLITESQELFSQQKSAKALELLREAYGLDKNNALARTILSNALVEHAYAIVETDWWEAETLANEALALNPAHPTARTIHSRILDGKTKGSVEEWISQTRKLQSSGNLAAALSQIAEAFAVYPGNARLLQLQGSIQSDHSIQRRQARRRDLEDLRAMETELYALSDAASKKVFAYRIQAIISKYPTDGEILSVANALLRVVGVLEGTQAKTSESAARSNLPVVNGNKLPGAPPKPYLGPEKNEEQDAPSKPSFAPDENNVRDAAPPASPNAPPPPNAQRPSQQPQLVPGVDPPQSEAKVASRSPRREEPMQPRSAMPIFIPVFAAMVVIAAILFFVRKHHTSQDARVKTPAAVPIVPAQPAAAPAVSAPEATAVSDTTVPAPIVPASQPTSAPSLPRAGSEPHHNVEANHNIQPVRNLGSLLIVADQDAAQVFVNGKLQRELTQAGQLRLTNLDARDYVVQVSKKGFQDPPLQTVHLHKDEQAKLIFNLQALPHLASLTIQGGAPGTVVLVDQSSIGNIQPDGTLSVSTINPGDHTIELRKDRFKPRQLEKHFVAGGSITLAAPESTLEPAAAELRITFTPADARVAIAKSGEPLKTVSSGVLLDLGAGTYTLTARTADAFTRSSTLEVVAGQSRTLDLVLSPNGMSHWEQPAAWKQEGNSFFRKGGDFVLYSVAPASGTFVFSALLTKGRILQWVLNYSDPKNYVLFQMDENNFYRTLVRNGEKTNEIIVPDKGDKKTPRSLHIRVSPTEIVHQIRHGDSWTLLDRWTQPGTNLSFGKFGFYIPGSDEVALSSFAHYPDLNLH